MDQMGYMSNQFQLIAYLTQFAATPSPLNPINHPRASDNRSCTILVFRQTDHPCRPSFSTVNRHKRPFFLFSSTNSPSREYICAISICKLSGRDVTVCGTIRSDSYDLEITKGTVQRFSSIDRTVYESFRGLCHCTCGKIAKTPAECFRETRTIDRKCFVASQIHKEKQLFYFSTTVFTVKRPASLR